MKGGKTMKLTKLTTLLVTTATVCLSCSFASATGRGNTILSDVYLYQYGIKIEPRDTNSNPTVMSLMAAIGGLPPSANMNSILSNTVDTDLLNAIGGFNSFDSGKRPSYFSGLGQATNLAIPGQVMLLPIDVNADYTISSWVASDTFFPDIESPASNIDASILNPTTVGSGISMDHHSVSLDDVSSNAVPAPGGIAILMGALLCGRRRRRD
jgi:hypothetical protein